MKRHIKKLFVILFTFVMTAIVIGPPNGQGSGPKSNRLPIPGNPPIIVVTPGNN